MSDTAPSIEPPAEEAAAAALPPPIYEVRGLIYLFGVSKSAPRVKEFVRAPEHDNLLVFNGRPLPLEEFNKVAPKVLGVGAVTFYGVQPQVKLVRVLVESAPVEVKDQPPALVPPKVPVVDLPQVTVEPLADGFMLVDYRGEQARYMGTSQEWETDAGLVQPFATEAAARQSAPGPLVQRPTESGAGEAENEAAVEANEPPKPAKKKPAKKTAKELEGGSTS